jgi:hypothetical protein
MTPTVLCSPCGGTEVCHRPWPRLKTAERANRRYARAMEHWVSLP